MKNAAQFLQDLVAIPSVSSSSNAPVIDYVWMHLKSGPWKIHLHKYDEDSKVNMVATTGDGEVELALVCHTDTVPFDSGWNDALSGRISDGKLYGRGSCDVKGFLACMLASASQLDLQKLSKPLALVLTADEEIGCIGAKFLAKHNAIRSRYTIIGEPTGLQPVRAGKGYALAEIVVHGAEAHSAFPSEGRSAIFDAARIIQGIEKIGGKLQEHRDTTFDPPFTTVNVGLIQGGSAKNIIAGQCRMTVEWRPIPGQDPQLTANLIRDELAQLAHAFPGFRADFDVKRADPAFDPSQSHRLADLLESVSGRRSTTVAFGTEAAHLSPLTSEVVVFGPGDMTVAHKTGEYVRIDDLDQCVAHLTAIIQQLCG